MAKNLVTVVRRKPVMRMRHDATGVKVIVYSVYEDDAFVGWFTEAEQPIIKDGDRKYIVITDAGPQAGWVFDFDMRTPWEL